MFLILQCDGALHLRSLCGRAIRFFLVRVSDGTLLGFFGSIAASEF